MKHERIQQAQQTLNVDDVLDAAQNEDYIGFCVACGEERDSCDPDTEGCHCDACGEWAVYGAETLIVAVPFEGGAA